MNSKHITSIAVFSLLLIVGLSSLMTNPFGGTDGSPALDPKATRPEIATPELPQRRPASGMAPRDATPALTRNNQVRSVRLPSSLRGKVTDAAGRGLEGVTIRAVRKGAKRRIGRGDADAEALFGQDGEHARSLVEQLFPETTSRRDGTYVFETLPEGEYGLIATHPDFVDEVCPVLVRAGEVAVRDIALSAGQSITGRLVDSSGLAVEGAKVTTRLEASTPESSDGSGRRVRRHPDSRFWASSATTDQDGFFALAVPPEETFAVAARASGFQALQVPSVFSGDALGDIVLAPAAILAGSVRASDTGRPVAHFQIQLATTTERGETSPAAYRGAGYGLPRKFSDLDGTFFWHGLRAGNYSVTVAADGYVPAVRSANLVDGEDAFLDVTLYRGALVEGTVVEAETGRPIAGAYVHCVSRHFGQGTPPVHATTQDDGTFALDGVADGEYRVVASRSGYFFDARQPMELDVPSGQRLKLEMERAGTLRGTIRNLPAKAEAADSHLLVLASAAASDHHGAPLEEWVWFQGSETARFERDSLRPGIYDVELRTGKDITELGKVEIRPGESHKLDLSAPED